MRPGKFSRADIVVDEQFEPPRPARLSAGFRALHEVALGHDTQQLAVPVTTGTALTQF
jgi:hypothetical protein